MKRGHIVNKFFSVHLSRNASLHKPLKNSYLLNHWNVTHIWMTLGFLNYPVSKAPVGLSVNALIDPVFATKQTLN